MTMSMPEVERALRQLRLSGVRATLETRILESQASNLNFLETFSLILQDELDRRQSSLIDRLYRTSGLDERTSLEEFDWGYNPQIPKRLCFELHTLKFINEGSNAILIGPPGTGKSHVAKAIAYAAVRQGWRVAYGEADELLDRLAFTINTERRSAIKPYLDADLLVLDDLFLARQLPTQSADSMQTLLHQRYKSRRSILITSNRILEDWKTFIGDAALTSAILDRLLHRSVMVEFRGKSYRLKEAAARLVMGSTKE
ncbi:MAG: ATP-binding protein [Gammaproteobacteria bacterium]|nr:ATP-binding protein [Gammaproteobacteria bacterium]NBT45838.1 ATP-binding protein [Gammaproteobacteria bacterium]NBY21921.1 ATP-binding protein [Gammaproteobacteria bacterium]NDE57729.1 ATP-binding protein [Gammaproteobacteria bacterium]NDG87883.1 ATP-binding protein [Gammaproteobacteria bacterium]